MSHRLRLSVESLPASSRRSTRMHWTYANFPSSYWFLAVFLPFEFPVLSLQVMGTADFAAMMYISMR